MSRPQPSTFIVPPLTQSAAVTSKVVREPMPFVIVPAATVVNDARELIEPHWLPAIDAATD